MAREMYCPSCGRIGRPKRITPGYFVLEVVLWLFFIIPGLIYSVWRLAARYDGCPYCEQKGMIPTDSPLARPAIGTAIASNDDNTRKCPYCAEIIKAEAKLCRFCKSEVEPVLRW
jgi:hypothetical protein